MKLHSAQDAPDFMTLDVSKKSIHLSSFKGKKVFISFFRNVGCPVCHLRFHELLLLEKEFAGKGVITLSIYDSSEENLAKYIDRKDYYTFMIANPGLDLYRKYTIERSTGKLLTSLFKGVVPKAKQGKKLFTQKVGQDGHVNLMGGEFLIDETGKIVLAHYSQFIGDHLPIKVIKSFINQ